MDLGTDTDLVDTSITISIMTTMLGGLARTTIRERAAAGSRPGQVFTAVKASMAGASAVDSMAAEASMEVAVASEAAATAGDRNGRDVGT